MAPGARIKFGAPMFEPEVFRKQRSCWKKCWDFSASRLWKGPPIRILHKANCVVCMLIFALLPQNMLINFPFYIWNVAWDFTAQLRRLDPLSAWWMLLWSFVGGEHPGNLVSDESCMSVLTIAGERTSFLAFDFAVDFFRSKHETTRESFNRTTSARFLRFIELLDNGQTPTAISAVHRAVDLNSAPVAILQQSFCFDVVPSTIDDSLHNFQMPQSVVEVVHGFDSHTFIYFSSVMFNSEMMRFALSHLWIPSEVHQHEHDAVVLRELTKKF